jgi:hypothetical protein
MILFLIGMSCGAALMWFYFHWADLIRTRDEFYRAHPEHAPDDWRDTQ